LKSLFLAIQEDKQKFYQEKQKFDQEKQLFYEEKEKFILEKLLFSEQLQKQQPLRKGKHQFQEKQFQQPNRPIEVYENAIINGK